MLRCSGGSVRDGDETTRSPTAISPADGSTNPAISRSVVVLPQPDGPSRHTSSPCSMRSDTSSTTACFPYRLVSPRSSTDATTPPRRFSHPAWLLLASLAQIRKELRGHHRLERHLMPGGVPVIIVGEFEAFTGPRVTRNEAGVEVDHLVAFCRGLLDERAPHQVEVGPLPGLGRIGVAEPIEAEQHAVGPKADPLRDIAQEGIDGGQRVPHALPVG